MSIKPFFEKIGLSSMKVLVQVPVALSSWQVGILFVSVLVFFAEPITYVN